MSFALNNLKALLASKAAYQIQDVGYVVAASGGKVTVSSSQGFQSLTPTGILNVGDMVVATGNSASRIVPPTNSVEV